MFRYALESLGTLSFRTRSTSIQQVRELSQRTGAGEEDIEAQYAAARIWVSELTRDTIPMSIARISFARSSGAGGQHVNKSVTSPYLMLE
jgi:protein subunit release factor B